MSRNILLESDIVDRLDSSASRKPVSARVVSFIYKNLVNQKFCPYGVGDILQTYNQTAPATRWPGTTWEQMSTESGDPNRWKRTG